VIGSVILAKAEAIRAQVAAAEADVRAGRFASATRRLEAVLRLIDEAKAQAKAAGVV
jgi:hypothetical protein